MAVEKYYDHRWLVPDRVILSTLVGIGTLEDIEATDQILLDMLDSGDAPVHIIVNCTDLVSVPVNLTQVLSRMTHLHDPNLGKVVAYGVNRWVRFMATAIFPFTKTQLQFTNSLEEAITYIKQADYTVDWNGDNDS